MTFPDAWAAMLPPAIFIGLHMVEANVITPMIVGKRLTINPLLILVSLSLLGLGVGDDRARCWRCRC